MTRILSTLLVAALLLSGCASTPTTQQSTLEAAGIGGVVGGIACVLLKLNRDQCLGLIAAGGAIGATFGYSLAKDIEKRQAALAGKENDLDARLQYVEGLSADLAKFNSGVKDQIGATQAKIDQSRGSQQQLANIQQGLDNQIEGANWQLAHAQRALSELKQFREQNTNPSAALDAEIAKYEQLLTESHGNTQALASLRQRI